MIAIPVDSASKDGKSSKLFGNVTMFALYEPSQKDEFLFIKNEECGNGIQTAAFLASKGVKSVIYTHLGKGPFGEFMKNNVEVFYIGKEPLVLSEIADKMQSKSFVKVDESNAATYLDPGTPSHTCECSS